MFDNVYIQAQDLTGNWRSYSNCINQAQRILQEMKALKNRYPNFRVRCVDKDGRVVDIYG
jgi:hypothetical protein